MTTSNTYYICVCVCIIFHTHTFVCVCASPNLIQLFHQKKTGVKKVGAQEMSLLLRALAFLPEDCGLIPRTHIVAHDSLKSISYDSFSSSDFCGH